MTALHVVLAGLPAAEEAAMLYQARIFDADVEILSPAESIETINSSACLLAYPVEGSAPVHAAPAIAVGLNIDPEQQVRALRSGASDVIDLAWSPELVTARLMQLFAHQELRERVATHFAAKERDLADARTLQLGLVPPPLRDTRVAIDVVLEPALELGGDLVDYIPIADGRIVLALGDVSGKGAAAALTMARTHTLLRSLALRSYAADIFAPPDIAARRLNGMLAINNDSCIFVTMFLGLFDPASGRLLYIRGGQIPPFLRRHDGAIERLDAVGGLPLGVFEDAPYDVGEVVLSPGDILLIVSDGVTEAESPAGELLDDDPVAAWLEEPREDLAPLVELTRLHEAGGSASDDLSAMLVRFH